MLLQMAKSQPRAYREMLEEVMQEHFSSEHGLVEDLSAARRKRAKAVGGVDKVAFGGGMGRRQVHHGSPERAGSESPARSPVRGGHAAVRRSRDEEISEVQMALKHHADHETRQRQPPGPPTRVDSRLESEVAGRLGRGSRDHMPSEFDAEIFFLDHLGGKGVGGWVGPEGGQAHTKAPLRQILPAYLRAGGGGAGNGTKGKLAKHAVKSSFGKAAANENRGPDPLMARRGRQGIEKGRGAVRSHSHLGVEEDIIARTWAAPEFVDGSDDDGGAMAWQAREVQDAVRRPRSTGSDKGLRFEPLQLDSMASDPSGHSATHSYLVTLTNTNVI